jgi:hypothetical protein
MIEILDLRPREILELYWMEQITIEETARFLEPVYFWETEVL